MRARKVFFVGVDNAELDPIAPKIHAAFAALAKYDPDGKWPQGEPFYHDDVTLCWEDVRDIEHDKVRRDGGFTALLKGLLK